MAHSRMSGILGDPVVAGRWCGEPEGDEAWLVGEGVVLGGVSAGHLGGGLVFGDLPPEMVTETLAVLAKRGAGKTYAASVLAEEMISAGLPVCVIDPLGVWWGLRSAADGDGPGLPVTILGGDHADLDLAPDSGVEQYRGTGTAWAY